MADHIDTADVVMGHELAGTVVGLGAGVGGFAEGDQVCVFPLVACGRCPACLRGSPALLDASALIAGSARVAAQAGGDQRARRSACRHR